MIAVDDLTFGYQREEALFEAESVEFRAGEVTVMTGRSGSGKSTLLYLLGLLLTPWRGTVRLEGRDVGGLSDRERSRIRAATMGFVFQDAGLDPSRTVIDNVCEAGLYSGMRLPDARRRAGLLLDRFQVGLRADHKPGEVSGGQAQRVALCRALLNHPKVVLADEPTGNLDQESAQVVLHALAEAAAEGAAVIIASHDPQVTALGDRRVEVGDG